MPEEGGEMGRVCCRASTPCPILERLGQGRQVVMRIAPILADEWDVCFQKGIDADLVHVTIKPNFDFFHRKIGEKSNSPKMAKSSFI